jgi:hypothetical protein
MTGVEAAEKDANAAEATQQVVIKAAVEAAVEEEVEAEVEAKRKAEALIDDELLTSDSDSSEVNDITFTGRVSPSARPVTPEVTAEATRKRTYTLVHRTPDKPQAAPAVVLLTPSNTITSNAQVLTTTPPGAHEVPVSTAPARLDGRIRREGKNHEYIRAMAIERGRERGGRGGRGGRGRA